MAAGDSSVVENNTDDVAVEVVVVARLARETGEKARQQLKGEPTKAPDAKKAATVVAENLMIL